MEVHPGERRKVELPEFGTNLFGIGSVSNRLRQYNKSILRRNPLGLLGTNSEESVIVSGQNVENGGRRRGRPTTQVARCANSGRQIRKHLCDALRSRNLIRPVGRKYGKRDRHNRVTEQMV